MRSKSLQIAIAAVGVALAVPCIILTNYVPLSVTLLTVAAVCYYIVFEKAGVVFGFLAMAAASGLSFAGGVGTGQILNLILFVPYAVLAYFLRFLKFGNWKHMVIRAAIMTGFANLVFMACFFLIRAAFLSDFISPDFIASTAYIVVALIFTAVMIAVDMLFGQTCKHLCARIKIGRREKKKPPAEESGEDGGESEADKKDENGAPPDPFGEDK